MPQLPRMYTFDQRYVICDTKCKGKPRRNLYLDRMASAVNNSGKKGWLVSILELGAWAGVLMTGYFADKLSRKYTILLGM